MSTPRKRRLWSPHEEGSLRKGVIEYGVGNWQEMLKDPSLYFDRRTAGDLKDKYRNILKKEKSVESSFKVTRVERPHKSINSMEVPALKEISTNENGKLCCLLSMVDVGEKRVALEKIPKDLLPSLLDYKSKLVRQLELVEEAIEKVKRSPIELSPSKTLKQNSTRSSPSKEPKPSSLLPLQIVDETNNNVHGGLLDRFETQLVEGNNGNLPVDYITELETKRKRIIDNMEMARKVDNPNNCIIS